MSNASFLIVEDEAIVAMGVERRVLNLGYRVSGIVDTGEAAVSQARNNRPDLVLMDINLAGKMDGIEAAKCMREDFLVPVIFLTAYGDDETIDRAKLSEPVAYLHKPIQDRDLRTAIEVGLYRALSERRLRESERGFAVTVRSIAEAILVTDNHGRVTALNPLAERLTAGAKARRLALVLTSCSGWSMSTRMSHTPHSSRKSCRGAQSTTLAKRHRLLRELARVSVEGSISPLAGNGLEDAGVVVCLSDVSERRALEHRLRQMRKRESLGILAAGVAHHLNNLLTPVIAYSEVASGMVIPEGRLASMLASVSESAVRAVNIVREIANYSYPVPGKRELIDVSELVKANEGLLRLGVPDGIALRYALDAETPPVEGDSGLLLQVLTNVVTNAGEAVGKQGGVISITTSCKEMSGRELTALGSSGDLPAGEYVVLEVEDNGGGMTAEVQEKVFDPFFTTKFLGRGLGLSTAFGIVRQYRGVISVSSQPDTGTTVRVCLPTTQEKKAV